MLSTGMPELKGEDDILYLKKAFALDMDDASAAKYFTRLIYDSLNSVTTQINFTVHNVVHSEVPETNKTV